jgi:hypothetical protein
MRRRMSKLQHVIIMPNPWLCRYMQNLGRITCVIPQVACNLTQGSLAEEPSFEIAIASKFANYAEFAKSSQGVV